MKRTKAAILLTILLSLILLIIQTGCESVTPDTTVNTALTSAAETSARKTSEAPSETSDIIDSGLMGKWFEDSSRQITGLPYKSIELFDDGTLIVAGKSQGTYEIVDGKIIASIDEETYSGKYDISGSKLTITLDDGQSKSYTSGSALLIGKWVEEIAKDINGLPLDSIEFFEDGTATVADRYTGTYRIVDGKLEVEVTGETHSGDYSIYGSKLTITLDDGQSKVYLKK